MRANGHFRLISFCYFEIFSAVIAVDVWKDNSPGMQAISQSLFRKFDIIVTR